MIKGFIFFTCLLLFTSGCQERKRPKRPPHPLSKEAFVIHEQSRERYKDLAMIRNIVKDSCEKDVMVDLSENPNYARELHVLDSLTTSWAETLTEVPRIQDFQHHHPDHRHGPSLIKDLRPHEVLKIQQIHRNELDSLINRWRAFIFDYANLKACMSNWPIDSLQKI